MLDVKFLRDGFEDTAEKLAARGVKTEELVTFKELDAQRRRKSLRRKT